MKRTPGALGKAAGVPTPSPTSRSVSMPVSCFHYLKPDLLHLAGTVLFGASCQMIRAWRWLLNSAPDHLAVEALCTLRLMLSGVVRLYGLL